MKAVGVKRMNFLSFYTRGFQRRFFATTAP